MTLSEQQAEFLLDACKLIQYATQFGWRVTGGELARTPEQQEIYFKTGKSKTMQSLHLSRLAIDLNFLKNGQPVYDKTQLAPLGAYWEGLNKANSWGGNGVQFVDTPHFSRGLDGKPEFRRVTN